MNIICNKYENNVDISNALLLMSACGSKLTSRTHYGCPMLECLEEFTVGTDLIKRSRRATVIKDHCLLRNFKITKAENDLKNIINKSKRKANEPISGEPEEKRNAFSGKYETNLKEGLCTATKEDYVRILQCIDGLAWCLEDYKEECVPILSDGVTVSKRSRCDLFNFWISES